MILISLHHNTTFKKKRKINLKPPKKTKNKTKIYILFIYLYTKKYNTVQYFNTVAMGRCQSTPGLVESCGRTTLEDMDLPQPPLVPHSAQHMQQQRQTPHDQVQQQQQNMSYR